MIGDSFRLNSVMSLLCLMMEFISLSIVKCHFDIEGFLMDMVIEELILAYCILPNKADTSDPAWTKRKILSTNKRTSCSLTSRKYSAIVRAVKPTLIRASA
ncbi:hypothetical protein L1987_23755 [Smallanthus sonchifolius]|uniref:Uncharacterized protein n=1 Tax=Smallanthus sonchifolius TaxID=185202 RepID=A0ACB9IK13_9ASTR|nr:hypothetical protein L1987_23755 [Smallanthus sonchifolius]